MTSKKSAAVLCALLLCACSPSAKPPNSAQAEDKRPTQPLVSPAGAVATATGGQRGDGHPYEVVGTEVWDVDDPASGRDYQVFIALPAAYAENPQRRYPVLYVTDADYAFPLIKQMARRLNGEGPAIEDFILVGLSYALGDDGMTSRRRDYTPTASGPASAPAGSVHGNSREYTRYLREQVLPFVAARYRTDESRRMLLGHSYGALLGTQILQEEPSLFAGYILGSPSYWYDKQYLLKQEMAHKRTRTQLPAQVYMYVGEREAIAHGASADMVAEAEQMAGSLRGTPGLQLQLDVLADEDHLSVAPRGFMLGLKHLLGVAGKQALDQGARDEGAAAAQPMLSATPAAPAAVPAPR